MPKEYKVVAEVSQLYHYPIKSMRGQSISETKLGWHRDRDNVRNTCSRLLKATGHFITVCNLGVSRHNIGRH